MTKHYFFFHIIGGFIWSNYFYWSCFSYLHRYRMTIYISRRYCQILPPSYHHHPSQTLLNIHPSQYPPRPYSRSPYPPLPPPPLPPLQSIHHHHHQTSSSSTSSSSTSLESSLGLSVSDMTLFVCEFVYTSGSFHWLRANNSPIHNYHLYNAIGPLKNILKEIFNKADGVWYIREMILLSQGVLCVMIMKMFKLLTYLS